VPGLAEAHAEGIRLTGSIEDILAVIAQKMLFESESPRRSPRKFNPRSAPVLRAAGL
jgi:hypothetical protein